MCRGQAWPEPIATKAPGDRSRGRAARSCSYSLPSSTITRKGGGLGRFGDGRGELADLRHPGAGARAPRAVAATATAVARAGPSGRAVVMVVVSTVVGAMMSTRAGAAARVDHAGRVSGLGRRVRPREMEVVAAPVPGVPVPPDPAPGHDRPVLPGLREVS